MQQWLYAMNKEDWKDNDGKEFRKGDIQSGTVQYKSVCTLVKWPGPRERNGQWKGGCQLGSQWGGLVAKYL